MSHLLNILRTIEPQINNSPVAKLNTAGIALHCKLEYCNFSGSIKDRAAYNILHEAILKNNICESTTVIESSSGNLAIALAHMCKRMGLRFIPVIDPNINPVYEATLNLMCDQVVKVDRPDNTEGYLLTRIARVKELCSRIDNTFWTNQYENEDNYKAYQSAMSQEIVQQLPALDYLFIAVSSGGTITGLSSRLKQLLPHIKVIGVDVEGSLVFGGLPRKRMVSGIGASKSSEFIKHAFVDDVVMVSQVNIVAGAHQLLEEQQLFAGASTGAVYHAIKSYFSGQESTIPPNVLFLAADRGHAYLDTVYNKQWCRNLHREEGVLQD